MNKKCEFYGLIWICSVGGKGPRCTSRIALAACGVLAAAGAASCSPSVPPPPQEPPVAFQTSIPVPEVMAHVMSPAAFQFWGGSGTVYTRKGEKDLAPKTEAEWDKVEGGAATIVIATNSLKLPAYAKAPASDWNSFADGVAKVALKGKEAAEQKDSKALFEIGGELDEACEACHKRFDPAYRKPKAGP